MAANVHPVSLVPDGARKAADFLACFHKNGLNARLALQLQCGSQARRSCSNDRGDFLRHTWLLGLFQVAPVGAKTEIGHERNPKGDYALHLRTHQRFHLVRFVLGNFKK